MVPFTVGSLNDRSATIRPGVESNPCRIEVLVVMATWGSRLRNNPRLREVSPTGKFLGGAVVAGADCTNSRGNHWSDQFLDPMRNLGQCPGNHVSCLGEPPYLATPGSNSFTIACPIASPMR